MPAPTPPAILQIGKRPIIDYVTKDYDGFREGMLALIPQLMPNWSDRSESDFGVVLIELFAYVADILSYYQDRVANEAYLGTATQRRSVAELLRLIDYQMDPGLAARAVLHLEASANVTVDTLPYRVRASGIPGEPDRTFEVTRPFSLATRNNAIAVAGPLVAGKTSITLASSQHALTVGDIVYFEETVPGPGGAPQPHRSAPLQLVDIHAIATGTDAIAWDIPLADAFSSTGIVLKGNNVVATHGETIADEPIFVGDGTPRQSVRLGRRPVTHLLASASGRRRSLPELTVTVDGVPWVLTDSFFNSGPFDPHFTVTIDENDFMTVRFGTGQRGAVLPASAQVKAIYRVGLGRAGNVGPGTITVPVTSNASIASVSNPFAAEGGAERESIDEAKISGPGRVITQSRAVTLEDYELLSKAFPSVGKARARVGLRGGYKVVQVYVVPEDTGSIPPPLPSAELKDGLRQELESRQPVNRMAGVDVLDPAYVAIDITVDVHVKADASASAVKSTVRAALERLLAFDQVDFGGVIRVGDVYATLFPIPGISFVQLRQLARRPGPAGSTLDDVAVADNELPYRGQLTVLTFGGLP
ncbi:MAG TPA: putative baseplate assembly protein [Kofleriaceae bacterium]|nr:putative baseplate assembly protein [Kofleriaceae bacterium]